MKAASGGHHEWKRMWFNPWAWQMRMMRFHESTSVGGYPVSGKIAHSSVPRRKILRPLSVMRPSFVPTSRNPKVTLLTSSVSSPQLRNARASYSAGREFAPQPDLLNLGDQFGTETSIGLSRNHLRWNGYGLVSFAAGRDLEAQSGFANVRVDLTFDHDLDGAVESWIKLEIGQAAAENLADFDFPTTPFQLPWVWSVTLWLSGPTLIGARRLSMRRVSVCFPGAGLPNRIHEGMPRELSRPIIFPSSHTVLCQWTRSRWSIAGPPDHSKSR
jgi:hypothetical protein